jgi:GH35 family endo-1,4-beta-xylanase
MTGRDISRRDFLYYGAAATAAGLAGPFPVDAQAQEREKPSLRVLLPAAEGAPLAAAQVKTIIARDLANDPLPQGLTNGEGESRVVLAAEPLQLGCRLAVPGFGEVYCYADNDGKGYSKPATIEFVVEAAKTRLNRVRQTLDGDGQAAKGDPEFERHLAAAARPIPTETGPGRIAAAYESLARGLHAGERLALLCARRRIARLPQPRKDFLFGAAVSGRDRSPEFTPRFTAAFNFATISWYIWQQTELPESTQIDYSRMDQSLQWCLDRQITPKGFGYVYLAKGATPEWLRSWPYEKLLPEYKRVVEQTMRRYAGRMPCAEIINEAHDKTNIFRLNHAQLLELTRESCRSAGQGAPRVKRLINNCCLWAEYAKNRNPDGSRKWSPYRYLADCVKSNVEFERIGLQLYYPQQDLFEIERMLDRFKAFSRPLHISEIACNSAPGLDAASMRPKDLVPGWHGSWSETMQADWMEAIYTLCYSKPQFEAVGWWDLADYPGHFWPHGGLLRPDFSPKESYFRLLTLKRHWGLSA